MVINWRASLGKLKWALLGIAALSGGGACVAFFQIRGLRKNLNPSFSVLEQEKRRSYIYIRPEQSSFINSYDWEKRGLKHATSELQNFVANRIPSSVAKRLFGGTALQTQRYLSPWELLHEASSTLNTAMSQRVMGKINTHKWMARKGLQPDGDMQLGDYECRMLGQNLDPLYLFALARTKDVDRRFFVPPHPLPPLKDESMLELMLYDLLTKLPQDDVESCMQYFTHGALNISDERQLKRGGMWCFGGNGLNYTRDTVSQEKVESFCLQALVKHSKIANHCEAMVHLGVLDLLKHIHHLRPDALKIQRNTVRIISNICVHENLHSRILASGWLPYLVDLSKSELLPMRIQASRALANLDRKNVQEKYMDGVYLLHPRHQTETEPAADIVLIHGLLGGAFHSWRQQRSDSIAVADRTQCWPEAWLARDLPNLRVVAVEYDTQLSDWMSHCPHEKQTRTISFRGQQILDKLKAAGIGEKRPVVWIAHSMGGLVLKNMLMIADKNKKEYPNVVSNTRGVIFYSTPHFGSQLAKYSRKVRKLLFPSVEVMALSHDSSELLRLNDAFKDLALERDIKVLSFGELQSTNMGIGGLKLHIVPEKSADPGIGSLILCDSDHLNVCKPVSRHSTMYHHTVDFVKACLAEDNGADQSPPGPADDVVLISS